MRGAPVADQPSDLSDGDRRLSGEQLRRCLQPPRPQVLTERPCAEVRIGALDLARRAGQSRRERGQRQLLAVAGGDEGPRLRVQAPPRRFGAVSHTSASDPRRPA
jgi:hypothetical protein